MGAIQAQDYLGSLWAVGLRTENATEQTIEQALKERTIVRTWPMRGTLHYVAPQDIRGMLRLLTPRIISLNAKRVKREYDLDADVFLDSRKLLEKAMQGEKTASP
ncbi:MAG: winged helix DNA-binding domain-containing protein [Bacteroidales bacterium]|nr:winged helix DNA-binding domain-containing protein [Bacteroidales bacterium]